MEWIQSIVKYQLSWECFDKKLHECFKKNSPCFYLTITLQE